uniref:Uncharacterized protein n=1 Tax=Setaria viridis TaxID=4556 RepID=A0A4U6VLY0_SETVI|nr:hypothetical protein SEVIR_3G383600v2 [Setaria viridis]
MSPLVLRVEAVHPLKAEASVIRLWLARVANHLEREAPSCKDPPATDLVDLFGPCSPIQRSPTPLSFTSLAADYTPTRDSELDNEQYVATIAGDVEQSTTQDCVPPTTDETMMLQVGTSNKEFVMVEDASEDEEANSIIDMTFEDPVDLIIAADDSTQSSVEVKSEHPDDPLMEVAFPMDVTIMKIEELQVCKRKSYDRTSLRRSIRLTQGNTLRRLGIIENDGKFDEDTIIGNDGEFDEDTIQDYADYLKELLPPDVLNSLMRTKGRAFWTCWLWWQRLALQSLF